MTIRDCHVIKAEGDAGLRQALDPSRTELLEALSPTGADALVEQFNDLCDNTDDEVDTVTDLPEFVTDEVVIWFIDSGVISERELAYNIMANRDTEYAISVETSSMGRHYTVLELGAVQSPHL